MQPRDSVAVTPAVDRSGPSNEPLVPALQSLYLAYQKTSIYPPGHPAIPEVLQSAIEGFELALAELDRMIIGVARDALLVDEIKLQESTGAVRSLAMLLHDLDVAKVEFDRGLDSEELEKFIHLLGKARQDAMKGSMIVEAMTAEQLDHLRVVPIDYGSLTFKEGRRDPADVLGDDVWESLSAALSDESAVESDSTTMTPEMMAEAVNEAIELQEGAGAGVLRKRMRRVSRRIDGIDPEKRDAIRERLTKFVAALNPKLRRDLLRFDPKLPGEALSMIEELGDVMPEVDLLDALQNIDRAGARLPGQLITLMNKLIRISDSRPSLASGLRDTLTRWGASPAESSGDARGLRTALEEVFQRRDKVDSNPEPYQALLQDLSRHQLSGTDVAALQNYRDPRKRDDLDLHIAEITVRLLNRPGGEAHRAGLFASMQASTTALLDRGRLDLVRDAAMAARTYSVLKTEFEQTQKAAQAYLAEFSRGARTKRILELVTKEGEISEVVVALLTLGGLTALEQVLDTLAADPAPPVADRLRHFVARRDRKDLDSLLEARSKRGWEALRPLFLVLREMPGPAAEPLLERLMAHEELQVRRKAVQTLIQLDTPSGTVERHLRRLLADRDESLLDLAIRSLVKLDGARAVELLGGYVEGSLANVTPSPKFAMAAAIGLLERGEEGLTRLCRSFRSLAGSFGPRNAAVTRRLAQLLEEHRGTAEVDRSLKLWRRSPSRFVGLVVPRFQSSERSRP